MLMSDKKAVLLLNLGSPEAPTTRSVRSYLKEFLNDKRVLDAPQPWRWIALNCFILPFRPKKSAHAYSRIWTPEGSPLMVTSYRQQAALQKRLSIPVELAMSYGSCSIEKALQRLKLQSITSVFIIPLYPHYAMSSYESVVVKTMECLKNYLPEAQPTLLQPFYKDPDFICALVESARPYLKEDYDLLLFSYHGIPKRHLCQTDPSHAHCQKVFNCCSISHPAHATCYRHQCLETTRAFAQAAGLSSEQYQVSFQSRLGREPWLEPYTDQTLAALPSQGYKRILTICPAFVTDCLETLEEIQMEGKATFIEAGGEVFRQIPCLNDQTLFIDFLENRIKQWI